MLSVNVFYLHAVLRGTAFQIPYKVNPIFPFVVNEEITDMLLYEAGVYTVLGVSTEHSKNRFAVMYMAVPGISELIDFFKVVFMP